MESNRVPLDCCPGAGERGKDMGLEEDLEARTRAIEALQSDDQEAGLATEESLSILAPSLVRLLEAPDCPRHSKVVGPRKSPIGEVWVVDERWVINQEGEVYDLDVEDRVVREALLDGAPRALLEIPTVAPVLLLSPIYFLIVTFLGPGPLFSRLIAATLVAGGIAVVFGTGGWLGERSLGREVQAWQPTPPSDGERWKACRALARVSNDLLSYTPGGKEGGGQEIAWTVRQLKEKGISPEEEGGELRIQPNGA